MPNLIFRLKKFRINNWKKNLTGLKAILQTFRGNISKLGGWKDGVSAKRTNVRQGKTDGTHLCSDINLWRQSLPHVALVLRINKKYETSCCWGVACPIRMFQQSIGVAQPQCCSGRFSGDYRRRCTPTIGVRQILYLTQLISEIKVYSLQRSFIATAGLFLIETKWSSLRKQRVNLVTLHIS